MRGITCLLLVLGLAAPSHAQLAFESSPVTVVDGDPAYAFGIELSEQAATVTGDAIPSWLSLAFEDAWNTTTFAGSGEVGFVDGAAETARFKNMYGIVYAPDGFLYIADTHNHAIRKVDAATGDTTTLAGNGLPDHQNGTGTAAQFFFPQGIDADGHGAVYVADAFNHVVRRVDTKTGATTTVAGLPAFPGSDDGAAGRLFQPKGLAVASDGSIYIADSGNHTIRRVTEGALETVAGRAGVTGSQDGTGSAARFSSPRGMEFGPDGHLYIADKDNHRIRKLNPSTLEVTTVAGSSKGNTDGEALSAQFFHPFDVAVDSAGNLFVPDSSNHQIRRVDGHTGAVTTVAGHGAPGYTNGLSGKASFYFPRAVTVDDRGHMFVSDRTNGSVRRVAETAAQLLGNATPEDIGSHAVALSATNGGAPATLAFNIEVAGFNSAPHISGTPTQSVHEGQPYSFQPLASDPDEDGISFDVFRLPPWASFDQSTGEIFGTPGFGDAGLYFHIAITVDDGQAQDNSRTTLSPFAVRVLDENRTPTLEGQPRLEIPAQTPYSFSPSAADEDTDNTLVYSARGLPSWLAIDEKTGSVFGTPSLGDVGVHSDIFITVTDSSGADNAEASIGPFAIRVTGRNTSSAAQGGCGTSAAPALAWLLALFAVRRKTRTTSAG